MTRFIKLKVLEFEEDKHQEPTPTITVNVDKIRGYQKTRPSDGAIAINGGWNGVDPITVVWMDSLTPTIQGPHFNPNVSSIMTVMSVEEIDALIAGEELAEVE